MSRSQYGLHGAGEWHQLEPLFPDLAGKAVLDLGCGYGWHCKYAADRGAASVLGIDQSERMLGEAIRRNTAAYIEYRVCSIGDYDYPAEAFDLVISNLVLHYIEDLDAVYRQVHRTLKAGGTFLFNIEHPTFTAGVRQQFAPDGTWPVTDYYYPGERTTEFLGYTVKKYHHTLTQILNGLLQCGFAIEAVEEAMPPAEWQSQMPEEMQRPMMLLVRAGKR
ncbi:MAG: class I SAM-dependent methyltransferase [Clostridia bacterium]|nr:class I SAM-dependent methyltransferase [Clostridia bacterium]